MPSWRVVQLKHGKDCNRIRILVRKLKGKRITGKLRCRWRGSVRIKQIYESKGGKVWNRFIWLRIGTSGGLL
jgi:hypothetical protein